MPKVSTPWENLTDEKWERLARNWVLHCESELGECDHCEIWGTVGMELGMWGPADSLWRFLQLVLSLAETDSQLGLIAAGPMEYLLGRFGPEYIDRVEQEVFHNPKFAAAIKRCN